MLKFKKITHIIDRRIADPIFPLEAAWSSFTGIMIWAAALMIGLLVLPICADIAARSFLGFAIDGIIEIETLALVPITFLTLGFITINRQHIQVGIFFDMFAANTKVRLIFLSNLACFCASSIMVWQTYDAGLEQMELTPFLYLPVRWFIWITSLGFMGAAVSFLFQIFHSLRDLAARHDWTGLSLPLATIALLVILPFAYKASGARLSGPFVGALGFFALFSLLLLRVPIAFAMIFIGILGLVCLKRTPAIALATVGDIPYMYTADFILTAIPMFMLMGELISFSGISKDLFECANRWLGRMPGGLATATMGGCAGFSAICGESLPTVITMSSVALPPMREQNYDPALAAGTLAAGGTLGILIPPSIGFIFYSIITEESVGRLFVAGIIPGLILTATFIAVIIMRVWLNPALAPRGKAFSFREKTFSLLYLLPIGALFTLVIGGILAGIFTPGEGGAIGASGASIYAAARGRMNAGVIKQVLIGTATMSGKIFIILAGVYCFGAFLGASRLPHLLAESIADLEINRYLALGIIIFMYIALGCVMNILPMMLLTLPSIYPVAQALQFDGVWFGVITVMLMEMGLITPPVGMIIFTMSSLAPDIPMTTIFRGVLPFVLVMFMTIILIIAFPDIALWLPNLVFGETL